MIMKQFIQLTKAKIVLDQPLSEYCTYGIGGKSKYYCKISDVSELNECIQFALLEKIPYQVIGNGSNVIFDDKGYNGLIINLSGLDGLKLKDNTLFCGAGVKLNALINYLKPYGFLGIEKLYGIPATLGGALCMNAGCLGQSIADRVVKVNCLYKNGFITLHKNDCRFGYRESLFSKGEYIIVSCELYFENSDKEVFEKELQIAKEYRAKQPKGKSCGCVFKNPNGLSAGKLIEECGLKGYRIGGAFISDVHANYIINDKNATFEDVKNLIKTCKEQVKKRFNVDLLTELKYIGNYYGFNE